MDRDTGIRQGWWLFWAEHCIDQNGIRKNLKYRLIVELILLWDRDHQRISQGDSTLKTQGEHDERGGTTSAECSGSSTGRVHSNGTRHKMIRIQVLNIRVEGWPSVLQQHS